MLSDGDTIGTSSFCSDHTSPPIKSFIKHKGRENVKRNNPVKSNTAGPAIPLQPPWVHSKPTSPVPPATPSSHRRTQSTPEWHWWPTQMEHPCHSWGPTAPHPQQSHRGDPLTWELVPGVCRAEHCGARRRRGSVNPQLVSKWSVKIAQIPSGALRAPLPHDVQHTPGVLPWAHVCIAAGFVAPRPQRAHSNVCCLHEVSSAAARCPVCTDACIQGATAVPMRFPFCLLPRSAG